jgi:hypothetical protein
MGITMRGRQDRAMRLFKISHLKSLFMLMLIITTVYLIFKPVHPTINPTYKVRSITMLAMH